MLIQWYPGHMTKAKRMLEEHLKLIDVVVELVDARAPRATRNPDFDALFARKQRLVLLNKADLADPARTRQWLARFDAEGIPARDVVATRSGARKQIIALIEAAAHDEVERMRRKGVAKTVRVMVAGIPNTGKSTLINCVAGRTRATVGDKPGVTRGKQWVAITPHLELLDTPGLLWPKLEDQRLARHLAYLGSIKDDIMDVEALASGLLEELQSLCPAALAARYSKIEPDTPATGLLPAVARSRGFLLPGGGLDRDRAARIVLDEFRGGKIARVTLDDPGEVLP